MLNKNILLGFCEASKSDFLIENNKVDFLFNKSTLGEKLTIADMI